MKTYQGCGPELGDAPGAHVSELKEILSCLQLQMVSV